MKRNGAAALAFVGIIVIVLVVLGLLLIPWYIRGYNKAIRLEEEAKTAWANVDSALQRRLDLIPNLVETVKGYATHESELFEKIAQARTQYFQTNTPEQRMESANTMTGLLSRLLVLQERYPELKANQNFLALQDSLEGTENRINVARTRYNEAARDLNVYAREFIGSFFARRAGVKPMPMFEAAPEAQTAPKVDFSK
ncbi:MAG: LemA family protein [Planctomycetaceae bacterium]|nr:LemA family protein [Planctomycetaceae bacterium]